MRTGFAIGSVIALSFFLVACSDDNRPDDTPRTVPPVSADGAATTAPVVKGVGPSLEASAVVFTFS